MTHVAPAARVLTVIHLTDGEDVTRCGQPMPDDELWTPLIPRPGERICRGCETGQVAEQETLLWP